MGVRQMRRSGRMRQTKRRGRRRRGRGRKRQWWGHCQMNLDYLGLSQLRMQTVVGNNPLGNAQSSSRGEGDRWRIEMQIMGHHR